MRPPRFIAVLALALALLVAALSPIGAQHAHAAAKSLLVIVAASAQVKDISTSSLRRIFQGLPTEFENGKRFIPLNHATGTPGRVQFDRAVLGLEPTQIGAFWIDRRIRDESPPPRTIPSPELALRIVASLPGAITYVYPEMMNATVHPVTVEGKSPGQPGYLLK